ncbi:hypothetical protein B7463_g11190, partial [Scytalidium lignicola]
MRIFEAKQWLAENPTESQTVAAKLFKINRLSLAMSIKRDKQGHKPHGGQNKILTPSQEQVIHTFICSYLENRQLLTKDIIFGAICNLRRAHELTPPSYNWFRKVLDEGYLATVEQDLAYQRIEQFISRKPSSRKRLQKEGELTAEYAQNLKQEKERKVAEKEANKEARIISQTPINYPIRTSFAKPELQEQEQQPGQEMEESEEEDFLRLDIEGEFGYSGTSSESECSLNSSISDEEDYYVL